MRKAAPENQCVVKIGAGSVKPGLFCSTFAPRSLKSLTASSTILRTSGSTLA
jgi:hypothetical protein